MGRHLVNGVLTRFKIKKNNNYYSNFDLQKELYNVLKDMGRIIDVSLYELTTKGSDYYEFSLKPNIFDNNIHDLIREISPLTFPNVNYFAYSRNKFGDINNKSFIDNFPFKCKINSNGKYYIEINDNKIDETQCFMPMHWILSNYEIRENVKINACIILLWIDEDKYDGEDETNILRLINNMKTKYYNSELSKALIYHVD